MRNFNSRRLDDLSNIVANRPPPELVPGWLTSDVFSSLPRRKRSRKSNQQPIVFLPLGRTLVYAPGTLSPEGSESNTPEKAMDIEASTNDLPTIDSGNFTPRSLRHLAVEPGLSRFRRKRLRQHQRWMNDVLPGLIAPYMELLRRSESLRNPIDPDASAECYCGGSQMFLDIVSLSFTGLRKVTVEVCSCRSAPRQLLEKGLFGSAPCFPTLAVDINVLEFCLELFVRMPPNKTAFCLALQAFLKTRGYLFDSSDSLRKRFVKCLHWFHALRNITQEYVDSAIFQVDTNTVDDGYHPSEGSSPPDSPCPRTNVPLHDTGDESGEENQGNSFPTVSEQNIRHRTLPSKYLQNRCPACFGDSEWKHDSTFPIDFHVCIDACFQQKRGQTDRGPPLVHPKTVFISEDEVRDMEFDLRRRRPDNSKRRDGGHAVPSSSSPTLSSQKAPDEILDECEKSFKAADERRQKASTRFFSDTGLMALLCRHDNVLWLANLKSSGEKQYYALALLRKFFQHIPNDAIVGVLYDIGCQLHRSISKWGLLPECSDRMLFAISVFHAYGHQWPCQIVYHPRKCEGFGLTDGEGCERFWSSIRHLIPTLRISSFYERLHVLDTQIQFISEMNISRLGSWLCKRAHDTFRRLHDAERILADVEIARQELAQEWKAQIAYQMEPLPRQSKNAGKTAIETIVNLEKRCEAIRQRVDDLHRSLETDEIVDVNSVNKEIRDLENAHKRLLIEKTNEVEVLGVDDKARLSELKNSSYVNDRLNARALHIRLVSKLRNRKFEIRSLERPYHSQQSSSSSEHKKSELIRSQLERREPGILQIAKKYNALCTKLQNTAPAGAVCPKVIPLDTLFDLDIDSHLWSEEGLHDINNGDVPRWMCDDDVRKGIKALLEADRCREELSRLAREKASLQRWFQKYWLAMSDALSSTSLPGLSHAIRLRQCRFFSIYKEWTGKLQSVPSDSSTDIEWGPTSQELRDFDVFEEDRTFHTESRLPAPFLSAPESTIVRAEEDAELDADDTFGANVDETDRGELLELAEQIENDLTVALASDLLEAAVENEGMELQSPTKRLRVVDAVHLPLSL